MKKIVLATLGLMLLAMTASAQSYNFTKETHLFAEKNGQKLYLDRYYRPSEDKTPCVVFVFGGAFVRGARDVEKYMPYFEYLVENGYSVVSIDYRLGLQNAVNEQRPDLEYFIGELVRTIDDAVEDLFDATRFILERADPWNIDPTQIVTNGSSAGAVTVLQAEYIIDQRLPLATKLPADFRYAGVISFAGAIFTTDGKLTWNHTPAPMMILHGNADLQVPFNTLEYGPMAFYGGYYVAETLEEADYPYYLIIYDNYGHEIASDPMQNDKEEVLAFLTKFVKEKKALKIRSEYRQIGKSEVDKDFEIIDYLRGNYDR